MTDQRYTNLVGRVLAKVSCGIASADDVDAVTSQRDARKPHHWFTGWMERAGAAQEAARASLQEGSLTAAAASYLRASEYYRAAASAYWPDRSDAAVADVMHLHIECFRAALDLDGPAYLPFEIPAGRVAVTGYLLQPPAGPESTPRRASTLMCCGPLDGTAEEQYGLLGSEALRHGWRVMLADPGGLERACESCDGSRQAMTAIQVWLAEMQVGTAPRMALAGLGAGAGMVWKLGSASHDTEVIWPPEGARSTASLARPTATSDVSTLAGALSSLRVPASVLAQGVDDRAPSMTGEIPNNELDRIGQES